MRTTAAQVPMTGRLRRPWTIAAVAHLVVVVGAMLAVGYPLLAVDGVSDVFEAGWLVVGLLTLAVVPAAISVRARLVAPAALVAVGVTIALIGELATPGPAFTPLGDHTLVVGATYLEWYASGWYAWLFGACVAGGVEYVLRLSSGRMAAPAATISRSLPFGWRSALVAGVAVGVVHAIVVGALATDVGDGLASGSMPILVWSVAGLTALGAVSTIALVRYRLFAPPIAFLVVFLETATSAFVVAVGTPVESYAVFWPVYLLVVLAAALGESLVRFGRRFLAGVGRRLGTTDDR